MENLLTFIFSPVVNGSFNLFSIGFFLVLIVLICLFVIELRESKKSKHVIKIIDGKNYIVKRGE